MGQMKQTPVTKYSDERRLLHELEVHQLQLEMQNEELGSARLELEAALARYTELFDFAPVGYVTLGARQTVREINHAAAQLVGKPKAWLVGKSFSSFLSTHDRAVLAKTLERALDSEKRETCEISLVQLRGAATPVRVSAAALAREKGTFLLTFEDISERRSRDAQLALAQAALHEADRRKDDFLAILSHELRNPLAPIRNGVYILTHTAPTAEGGRHVLSIIDRQVTHMTRLIDDLLDVTRIARGKIELRMERVEVAALVRRTLDDHTSTFDKLGVRLERRLPAGELWTDADPARLVQVVSNLLSNALKFTPRGGEVQLTLDRQGERIVLRVRDNGVGIPTHLLGKLFEPFAQAPQTMDRSRGGLGLGLAMVRGLVELHKGSVVIASAGPGQGTEVTLKLPLGASPGRAVRAELPAEPRRRRVLIIEDNHDAADILKSTLELQGHEVEVAHDGMSGLGVAREQVPEIVLCDLGLPRMDGYTVAREFRADPKLRDTFLVALSGYARPEDLQRTKAAGFDRHVAKPASPEKIIRTFADADRSPNG